MSNAASSSAPNPAGRKKAAILVARTIVREIRRRELQPGDKLISEEKMVARYGVARGTLREGLRFLELQGALQIKSGPGGGPIVARPGSEHLASTLSLLLQFAGAPIRSIVDARCVIEPGMAGLAAEHASEDDLAALDDCVRALAASLSDAKIFAQENRRFHDLVAEASGNTVLAYLIPALHWISDGSGITYTPARRKAILRGKRKLLRAIRAGDSDEAARDMSTLLASAVRYFEREQPAALQAPVDWGDADADSNITKRRAS
jgi:GntR family transcriptional repressor for pyruvate dehydrogenase complex